MYFLQSITTAFWVGSALGVAVSPAPLVLHEKRSHVPHEWIRRSTAPRDLALPVHLGIAQRNADRGHDLLMSLSDPDSENFGKHWSREDVEGFFAPDHDTVEEVRSWLHNSGIDSDRHKVAKGRGHVTFIGNIDEIERLFGSRYELYEHAETGDLTVSCDEYHVPEHLKSHLDFVSPSIGFDTGNVPGLKKRGDTSSRSHIRLPPIREPVEWQPTFAADLTNCSKLITPACLRALYGFEVNEESVPGNDLGVYEEFDTYDQKDLNLFFSKYYPRITNGTHPILQSIDGGKAPVPVGQGGGESTLDFELAFPIVYPQNIKLYQTFDEQTAASTAGIWNPFLDALDESYCGGDNRTVDPHFPNAGYNHTEDCGVYKPANVISISYALAEAYYSPAYERRQCQEYLKLGLQGTSILFASGDNGTVARAGLPGCLSDDRYNPNFPSSCPYITSVGGTELPKDAPVTAPEKAVYVGGAAPFTSGGGFSNVFPRPSWQEDAVAAFLEQPDLPPRRLYNAAGRGFPDVAASAWPIATYLQGRPFKNGGTSASAPIFASLVSRINGERLKAGKGPVGFLNPTLYKNPDAFNDIVGGYNLGCNLVPAFNATKGWDPVTGLGTPNYPKLLDVFMALP